MMDQRGTELTQPLEPDVRIAHQRRSVLIDIFGTRCDDREAIVRGRHAGRLDRSTHDVIDEGGFAGGMIADEEDEGEGGAPIGVLGERAGERGVERHYGGVEVGHLRDDGLVYIVAYGVVSFAIWGYAAAAVVAVVIHSAFGSVRLRFCPVPRR